MKPQIEKVEFTFKLDDKSFRVKWSFIGAKGFYDNAIHYKNWRVTVIDNWDHSGVANKIIGDAYTTTLQPNHTNAIDFLLRAIK